MKHRALTASAAALICATGGAVAATGADDRALIEEALSAAPPQVAARARVLDLDGNLLREGSGAFTCSRRRPPPPARCAWTSSGWPGWTPG